MWPTIWPAVRSGEVAPPVHPHPRSAALLHHAHHDLGWGKVAPTEARAAHETGWPHPLHAWWNHSMHSRRPLPPAWPPRSCAGRHESACKLGGRQRV